MILYLKGYAFKPVQAFLLKSIQLNRFPPDLPRETFLSLVSLGPASENLDSSFYSSPEPHLPWYSHPPNRSSNHPSLSDSSIHPWRSHSSIPFLHPTIHPLIHPEGIHPCRRQSSREAIIPIPQEFILAFRHPSKIPQEFILFAKRIIRSFPSSTPLLSLSPPQASPPTPDS